MDKARTPLSVAFRIDDRGTLKKGLLFTAKDYLPHAIQISDVDDGYIGMCPELME